jgi:hypothetical protein
MPPIDSPMFKVYEDIGSLKALFGSIDDKLDGIREDFTGIRQQQVQTQIEVSEIKAGTEGRSEAIARIEEKVNSLEQRVDQLVALRHRIGGAVFLLSIAGTAVFGAWSSLTK